MADLEVMYGPLQPECQKPSITQNQTVLVLPLILVPQHLLLWERTTSASQGVMEQYIKPSGSCVTLCGTHRAVQPGALVVIVADHGSVPK